MLHLETLAEDAAAQLPWLAIGDVPHECASKYPGWRAVLTDEAAAWVRKWAFCDFERYGYSLDPRK